MSSLDQLTLTGAISLLTCLQRSHFANEDITSEAIVAMLCEILNQLNVNHPGIATQYGWYKLPESESFHSRGEAFGQGFLDSPSNNCSNASPLQNRDRL